MKRKSLLIVASALVLSAVMVISAASLFTLDFNMSANVEEAGAVTVTVDSTVYTNGQSLSIDWGNVVSGEYTKDITITNNVNKAVTPSLSTTGLPGGWTLTLSDTSAISAFGEVTRTLVLNVPSSQVADSYSWSATLDVATA